MIDIRQGGCLVVVCVLVMTAPVAAQDRASQGNRELRRKMAGAWRSVPGKSHISSDHDARHEKKNHNQQTENARSAASAAGDKQPKFRGMSMDAIAQRMAELDQVLYFVDDLCVMSSEGRQMILKMRYEDGVARRTDVSTGMAIPGELGIENEMLVLRIPSLNFKVYYRRLDKIPESVRLDPYPLGTRKPNDIQRAAIQKEIARRMQRDQAVRFKAIEANKQGRTDAKFATAKSMGSVDQENTRRLVELIRDVGWLSKARFGSETQFGAFLIVQHSSNLRLMRTILPLIEEEAKNNPELGQSYALLYDRLQVSLGRKQRYGTQARTNPDGSVTIDRLEDRRRVDEWRSELGMEPLTDYARSLSSMEGVKVTIGE